MVNIRCLLLLPVLLLAACAGGPGKVRPGEPVVDLLGVDPVQYEADLADCRGYGQQVPVLASAGQGAAAGAAVGAVFGAVVGDSGTARRGAGAGAVAGGARGAGHAVSERRLVVKNCLVNRGYAVLN